jgi:hypothetical protein
MKNSNFKVIDKYAVAQDMILGEGSFGKVTQGFDLQDHS